MPYLATLKTFNFFLFILIILSFVYIITFIFFVTLLLIMLIKMRFSFLMIDFIFMRSGIAISMSYWLQNDPKSFLEAFKSFFILY